MKNCGFEADDIIIVDNAKDKLNYCHYNAMLFDSDANIVEKWIKAEGVGFVLNTDNGKQIQ